MSLVTDHFKTPKVMGILNVTPDSFSDGGQYCTPAMALQRARQLIEEGADIIDIGGESTRPGAESVLEQVELDRIMPVVEQLRAESPIWISVDTSKPAVMQAAIAAGVNMINDINAFQVHGTLDIVAPAQSVYLCCMHKQGSPQTMQHHPHYQNVVREVQTFLHTRLDACLQQGIAPTRLLIDPGFGFGKTLEHNLQLVKCLSYFTAGHYPVLIGVSRKSMIGNVLNKSSLERLYGGLALATLALSAGVKVIRTHDVAPTVDCLRMYLAIERATSLDCKS